jgi:hypothetical protein
LKTDFDLTVEISGDLRPDGVKGTKKTMFGCNGLFSPDKLGKLNRFHR